MFCLQAFLICFQVPACRSRNGLRFRLSCMYVIVVVVFVVVFGLLVVDYLIVVAFAIAAAP